MTVVDEKLTLENLLLNRSASDEFRRAIQQNYTADPTDIPIVTGMDNLEQPTDALSTIGRYRLGN